MSQTSVVEQILDLARWAPSGDNSQPWRFELINDRQFVIHGRDTREDCVYDLDGRPSQMSLGALIETATIAATGHGFELQCARRKDSAETALIFDARLVQRQELLPNPLIGAIPLRRVQRGPMQTRPLSSLEMQRLEAAVGPDHTLKCFCSWPERLRWAALLWRNAGVRLRLPEAFDLHRRIIQWGARYSRDRIPDQALGADKLTLAMMRPAMASWERLDFLNTWLGGTLAPRLTMDWIPALACAGHIAVAAPKPMTTVDDYVAAGRAVQRFWLTATQLGLQHQPAITPLVFARYIREGRTFTRRPTVAAQALKMTSALDELLSGETASTVWLGRLGAGNPASARSERLTLGELICVGSR